MSERDQLTPTPFVTFCRFCLYRELFISHIDPDLLGEIRNTLNQELVLGSGAFKQRVEAMLGRQTEEKPKGRPRKNTDPQVY